MDQNSTSPDTGISAREFGVVISLVVALIIVIVFLLPYFIIRSRYGSRLLDPPRWANHRAISLHTAHLNHDGVVIGIDEETLDSFPRMLYSQKVCQSFKSAEGNELDEAEDKKCCSICLSDYKESEVVRVMPDCTHMFHRNCIDEWLRLHATCPICRTSPLPSLHSSPLAQEAPTTTILTVVDRDAFRPFTVV